MKVYDRLLELYAKVDQLDLANHAFIDQIKKTKNIEKIDSAINQINQIDDAHSSKAKEIKDEILDIQNKVKYLT